MQKIELLAPAKNAEFGIAAINAGADAVYIGAGKFSARQAAGNNIEEISQLVEYAHKYYARVYAAVNTILYDNELPEVEALIHSLYDCGVDAIIIQDLGILKMKLPPIPIFASTQTNNYDLERIKFIDSLGIDRIILARELSLEQISEIRQHTRCELETFVYGSLCVSLSGQCYMSAEACSRSANRGECAQYCRHSFTLYDEGMNVLSKDKHLLSLKDLNLENNIEDLIKSGVSSFKIEGRLKDKNYIINSVAHFRQKIDRILSKLNYQESKYKKDSSGACIHHFTPDLTRTFNRTWTQYFLQEKKSHKAKMANLDTPKFIGKFVATVEKSEGRRLIIQSEEPIIAGDGLCYFDEAGALQGFAVNNSNANKIAINKDLKIQKGASLYRNEDIDFEKQLKNKPTERVIKAIIQIEKQNSDYIISAKDEDGNYLEASIQINTNDYKPLAIETILNQLGKSGNTIFEIEKVQMPNDIELKCSIAQINQIRRELLDKLFAGRIRNFPKSLPKNTMIPHQSQGLKNGEILNISNRLALALYSEQLNDSQLSPDAPEVTDDYENIPLMTTRYCIKRELDLCPKTNKQSKLGNALYMQDNNNQYKVVFDCAKCMMSIFRK